MTDKLERELQAFAKKHLTKWGYWQEGWRMVFDRRAKRRLGQCRISKKEIGLSTYYFGMVSVETHHNTILHEIAHIMSPPIWRGGYGRKRGYWDQHGRHWQLAAIKVGADPKRTANVPQSVQRTKTYKYILECPKCEKEFGYYRKPKDNGKACSACCSRYNGGRYSEKYKLVSKNPART